ILFTLFYMWASDLLKKQATDAITELSETLLSQLDSEVQKLDSVSISILYSNLITDRISVYESQVEDSPGTRVPEQAGIGLSKPNTDLYDILVSLVGPSYPVQQVYLYLYSGISIGVGF